MLPAVTPKNRLGLPSFLKSDCRIPVRLANDADAEALRFEQAPDQRHAEARVVDVGVAGDQDDVAGIPAQGVHFGARHGQEGRGAEARRPELAVAEQGADSLLNRIHGVFYPSPPALPGVA